MQAQNNQVSKSKPVQTNQPSKSSRRTALKALKVTEPKHSITLENCTILSYNEVLMFHFNPLNSANTQCNKESSRNDSTYVILSECGG